MKRNLLLIICTAWFLHQILLNGKYIWAKNKNYISLKKINRKNYFSARKHIFWHSSKVMLLKISTSNGPPSFLFASFTKTINPSQRLSANFFFFFDKVEIILKPIKTFHAKLLISRYTYNWDMCFPNNLNLDHLQATLGVFFV